MLLTEPLETSHRRHRLIGRTLLGGIELQIFQPFPLEYNDCGYRHREESYERLSP